MAPPSIRTIGRFAGWLAFAYILALSTYVAFFAGDGSLLGVVIAATWTAAPVAVAAGLVSASPNRAGASFFFLLELLLIASFGWEYAGTRWSSMGGLIFLSWPLLGWAAIFVAVIVACLFGWRIRPDFLLD